MGRCRFPPLCYLQMLRTIAMSCPSNVFPFVEADCHVKYQFPLESLIIEEWSASGKDLTQLLIYFPKLSDLQLVKCGKLTGLAVNVRGQHATGTPGPSSLANELEQQQGTRAEDDVIVTPDEAERGLLLLPPQLQELEIKSCPELSLLCSNPHDDSNEEDRRSGGEGGLRGTSLRRLKISDCPKLLSADLLLLAPQLQELEIKDCPELSLPYFNPHDDSNEEVGRSGGEGGLRETSLRTLKIEYCPKLLFADLLLFLPQLKDLLCSELNLLCSNPHGRSAGEGGLQGLTSLRRLVINWEWPEPELLSSYSPSSFSSSFLFPNSLEHLAINGVVGMDTMVPLSNLTSLTSLSIYRCGNLRGEGLLPLLAQGHLTDLFVNETPNFFVGSEALWMPLTSCSSELQRLEIDDVAGFTAAPIRHGLIFSSLTTLLIYKDNKVESFTEEQKALLFVNSLEVVIFSSCDNLQSLPKRLHGLRNLKRLNIQSCKAIQMLHKDVLPSSLEGLYIYNCPKIQSLPKDCLPDSLQKLDISGCPAIRSLPEVDDLPSSLRELDVSSCNNSEELRRQCRKLINIIPIVRA